MKMKYIFTVLSCLIFWSCQEDVTKSLTTKKADFEESTMEVDPYTPQGIQPYIIEDSNKRLPTGAQMEWVEIWSDEFEGTELDTSKWVVSVSTKSRASRPALGINDWWWKADHVWLNGNGALVLKGSKVDSNTMYCGSVESRGKFEPQYGFMEAKIKIADTSKGNHTAFWLQGANQGNIDGTGNDGAEIDIFESAWTADYTKAVIHIDGYGTSHQANTKKYDTPNIHSGYHIFGLLWEEDSLHVYYDGIKTVTYSGIWVPQVAEWLWLSVGASFGDGDFVNQPVGLLSTAEVDYVRFWKRIPSVFRVTNRQSGKYFRTVGDVEDSYIRQSQSSQTGGWTKWELQDIGNGYFYLVNEETGMYIRPVDNSEGAKVILKPTSYTGSWTQWEKIETDNGYFYLKNKETKKYIRPQTADYNADIILTSQADTWAEWKFDSI